jgi:hypothetical protein
MGKQFNAFEAQEQVKNFILNPVPYQVRTLRAREFSSMNDLQKSVLIAALLGDGCLQRDKAKNYFFKFDQKAIDYVNLIYSIFSPFVGTPPLARFVRGKLHSFWFRTFRVPFFKHYADIFYTEIPGTKTPVRKVPTHIHQLLNPVVLAFWYMDDGSQNEGRTGCYLHTECFEYHEVVLLQQALGSVFGFETGIHTDRKKKTGKVYYKLYICEKSVRPFVDLISPYVHPCIQYRLRK